MWLAFAVLSAVAAGMRGILYQRTSKMAVNRYLFLFGVYLTGAIVCAVMAAASGSVWSAANLVGLLMGIFSFTSNASLYKGFAVGKASLIAIVTGLYPAVVVTGAYALYGETLTLGQALSFFIVFAGVIMIRYSSDVSFRQLQGIGWGLLTMLTFALNDLAGKGATLLHADVYPTLLLMFGIGSACFYTLWRRGRRTAYAGRDVSGEVAAASVGWSNRRTLLWGMAVGLSNAAALILLLLAFREGVTGLVSAIHATSALMIVIYAGWFLKEKLTLLESAGIACAFVGVALIRLLG